MIAASEGESVIVVGCMQQRGSLLMSSGNRGHLSCTCRWSLHSHCLPSLSHVSYTAPQVSVTTGVHLSLQWWTHTPLRQSLCEFRGTLMLTNTIKPTWMHVKVNLRPYWENEFICVIMDSRVLFDAFDGVAELIVKLCLFCWTIYSIYLSNWIFSWYPENNKNTNCI